MRVVITGSRHWTNRKQIEERLRQLKDECPYVELAHGQSRGGGADAMADDIAHDLGIDVWPYPVIPERDGKHKGAPLRRNARMLRDFNGDKVIAFRAAGKSNGTDDCISKAEIMGYEVEVVKEDKEND